MPLNHSCAQIQLVSKCALPSLMTCLGLVASRVSLIVADVLVIGLTWCKLLRHAPPGRAVGVRRHLSLTEIFLRDGKHPRSLNIGQPF